MSATRPFVLSIAGMDPSGGAGVLADIKTFEALKVYGFGVVSALTIQNDVSLKSLDWLPQQNIISQVEVLFERFTIPVCKIGIMPSVEALLELIDFLRSCNPTMKIVVDPVLRSSSGFIFQEQSDKIKWKQVLNKVTLLTPNYDEMQALANGDHIGDWSKEGNILLKGGHDPDKKGWDTLHCQHAGIRQIEPAAKQISEKHGSGCVLSSAIAAHLALGDTLYDACKKGKLYTEQFLSSHKGLLGYHFA